MQEKERKERLRQILSEENPAKRDRLYNDYVEEVTPTHNLPRNVFRAFWVGGSICTLGQALGNLYRRLGLTEEVAPLYVVLTLVFFSALLTGCNLYQKLTRYAGAGSVVPITGFANSVAACAIEYKKEGKVFGTGCKIFAIAGPVILYGVLMSSGLGFLYWITKYFGMH